MISFFNWATPIICGVFFVNCLDSQKPKLVISLDSTQLETIDPNEALTWTKCYSSYQCTHLKVPLNYSQSNGVSAVIPLIRLPSKLGPDSVEYRGPLIVNPGGPGGSGVNFVASNGHFLSSIVGPEFDIVGFDPRGIGRSYPSAKFFETAAERALWLQAEFPDALNASPDVLPRSWARAQIMGQLAEERDNATLKHITTDNIARDMLRISEACGRAQVQYWGFSWGTILGVTFAAMFPNRIRRVVLDGVINAEDYYATLWFDNLIDTNKTMNAFFDGCAAAGPEACAFYAPNATAISQKLDDLYDTVRAVPVPVRTASSYGLVDYSKLRRAVFTALYSPYERFASLAKALSDLSSGDGTALIDILGAPNFECGDDSEPSSPDIYESGTTLHCVDGEEVHDSPEELQAFYEKMAQLSTLAELWAVIRIRCSGWRVRAGKHFTGPFLGNTSFPILFVGNTADPVAPLSAAHKSSAAFPRSVVLTQDSPGHCSLSASSLCTQKHVREYFLHGTLPKRGTVCPVDEELFPTSLGGSVHKRLDEHSEEDARMFDSIQALRRSFRIQLPV
ncbi:alpha/beta-hydrolase [Rickenella mellea]|uniref:Alpha/beta-hydrolase n=1 Tax=Rickenella mellea TaxID=50990 RepID=A0A4R5XI26_9AGAM|nr:alpha/beta-hydrolase [Rickenella mellea]